MEAAYDPAGAVPGGLASIRSHLIRRERATRAKVVGRALVGLPCLIVSWAVIALAFALAGGLVACVCYLPFAGPHSRGTPPVHFLGCLAVAALVALVALFWQAGRNPGPSGGDDVLGRINRAYDGSAHFTSAHFPFWGGFGVVDGDRSHYWDGPLQDLLLFGPRQVRRVLAIRRALRTLHAVDRDRAARVLQTLLSVDHGLPVDGLVQPGEAVPSLMGDVAYLLFYGWVDTSRDTLRVWATTPARVTMGVSVRAR